MKKLFIFIISSLCLVPFLLGYELTPASAIETNSIAQHWLILINKIPFQNKTGEYQIKGLEQVTYKGILLCEIYHLDPHGHIVVSAFKELSPLVSFSVVSNFDSKSLGYERMVLEELGAVVDYLEIYKKGEEKNIEAAINENTESWSRPLLKDLNDVKIQTLGFIQEEESEADKFLNDKRINFERTDWIKLEAPEIQDAELFKDEQGSGFERFLLQEGNVSLTAQTASPLLKTKWTQDFPFNKICPMLDGKRSYVGCTATALAQIMRYYKWPKNGKGSYSYWWSKGSKWLDASFSDSYDWENMPNLLGDYDTEREKDAVAELSYEVGVSVDMDYSPEGSGAHLWLAPYALSNFFKYKPELRTIYRRNFSYDGWFNEIKKQRDLMRPVALAIYNLEEGHAVVVDGYLISGTSKTAHVNMGWAGYYDAYYNLNKIYTFDYPYRSYAVINIIPDAARIQLNRTEHSFERMEGLSNPEDKYFDIKNSAGGSLSYLLTPDVSWIATTPKSGISYGEWDTIKVSVDISSLVEGRYAGKINITSDDASNSPQVFNINLHVKEPPIYPPLNFSGVKVENRSLSQVEYINSLSWEKNPQNRNIVKYLLFILEDDSHPLLAELDANTFKYWHRRVSKDKEYHYLLKAVNFKERLGESTEIVVK